MKFCFGTRRKCSTAIAAAIIFGLPSPALAQPQTYRFDIPAGDLAGALARFARITRRQLVFDGAAARQARSAGVRGSMSAEAALARLLGGTGFSFRTGSAGVLIVERAARDAAAPAPALAQTDADKVDNSEIIVTGTNIRGVTPRSSPLTVITRSEMDARGVTTAEQAINSLTQNFNSVNANGLSATRDGYFNQNGLNGVDLRGLGPGTTLVLLNGRRLSASSTGQVVDISLIPLSAVERIDVLTDSASSIYGSDAVGGVVNFVLRDRFQGLEATSAYGTTDDGAEDEFRASLTGGLDWPTGNLVAGGSYLTRSALTSDERDFSKGVGGLYNLAPPEQRYGLFLSGRQEAGDRLTFSATGLYGRRTSQFNLFRDLGVLAGRGLYQTQSAYDLASDSWFGSLGGTYRASDALSLDLVGSYSRVFNASYVYATSTLRGPLIIDDRTRNQTYDITASASGRLASLPGGDLSYSFGLGTTRQTIANIRSSSVELVVGEAPLTSLTTLNRHRSTVYGFGEINLPLVGPGNATHGLYRLEINASARYSHYSDFGGNLSPKVGLLWAPTQGFNLRASYGRTFRAPNLSDIGRIGIYQILDPVAYGFPDPTGTGSPIGLYIDDGVDPDLGPETSNLLAVGLDLRPPSVPNLSVSFTYVSIDYTNRIARGDPGRGTGYILHPELYGELYNFAPTRADFAAILASSTFNGGDNVTGFDQTDLDAIVANVGYILDNRLRNIAQSRQQAIDVSAAYAFTRGSIAYTLGANATYILLSEARTAPDSPLISQVNVLGRPVDLRANAYVGLSTGLFSARLTGNYVGAYANPDTPAFPAIGDWLTFDLSARYDFGAKPGLLAGTSILLSVRNLLNTNPPFVADLGPGVTGGLSEPIGYDPANASPLGRYIGIELRKRF